MTDLPLADKKDIQTRMLAIFPEDVLNSNYQQIALWLCTRFSVINPNMRDLFSAGGQVEQLGNITFKKKMPQVLKRFYDSRAEIFSLLRHPDAQFEMELAYHWENADLSAGITDAWLKKVDTALKSNTKYIGVDIRELFSDVI